MSEKCSPTPNISRMTPTSASWLAMFWSATKPGVNGPMTIPATQIADQRRQLEALRQHAKGEGEHEADGDGRYEWRHMRHVAELQLAAWPALP